MASKQDFENALKLIENASDVLITSHTKPDGDACGSIKAMMVQLGRMGKRVRGVLLSAVPKWYEFLFAEPITVLQKDTAQKQLEQGGFNECDLVVIVDTNSYIQLPNFDTWLKSSGKTVLVIDHHITGDGLGDVEVIDTSACAAGQIVLDLFRYAGWEVDAVIADALFTALATDSGWFKFSNTDARLFRDAAELIEAGARPNELYSQLYQNFTVQRLKLMTRMLDSLELYFDDRVAMQVITQEDFKQTGTSGSDTENLIDECKRIGSVRVAVLLVEREDGKWRCSIRSKGDVDVRRVAQEYGGGGHTNAAGVTLPGPLEKAKQMVLSELARQLK